MPRKSDSKEKLLETALNLVWSLSYSSVSVDDICCKAGVKKGSFYHYFESKADLAHRALEWEWERMLPTLNDCFSPRFEPMERVQRYLDWLVGAQLEYFEEHKQILGCPYASIASEQSGGDCQGRCALREKALSFMSQTVQFFESAFREAQAKGDLGEGLSPEEIARHFEDFYTGVLVQARISNDPSRLKDLAPVSLHFVRSLADSDSLRASSEGASPS